MVDKEAAKLLTKALCAKGIKDPKVLAAIENTPRELFVSDEFQGSAYADNALPIACGQTISQPYVVASMTQAIMQENPLNRVLEVGTGSGYQAAILSKVANEVYSIERIKELFNTAKKRLSNYTNIKLKFDDGASGWIEHAPYDGILVTAAAEEIPQALKLQLNDGGRLVIPVGEDMGTQVLKVITRHGDSFSESVLYDVRFVPMLKGTS